MLFARLLSATSKVAVSAALILQPIGQLAAQTVVVDRTKSRGTALDVTPNAVPIINIAAPNAGTSHNIFQTFNVGLEGLILNNGATNADTRLGGTILANPNLIRGAAPADLILNEVAGASRSELRGAVEVAGRAAAVIIANPMGITCDGCGFINTPRVTLSTGRPEFDSAGRLSGLAVSGGEFVVEGRGLLAGNVDFFEIVAGAARINADLFARDLVVGGGGGRFDIATRTLTGGNATGIVVDSSALGGMYANRIRLIGTGAGVGVNLRGVVAALGGDLTIESGGSLQLARTLADGNIDIRAGGALVAGGNVYAGKALAVAAGETRIGTGGLLAAGGDVSVVSAGGISASGGGIFAGLTKDGQIGEVGRITIGAGRDLGLEAARIVAGGQVTVAADRIALDSASLVFGSGLTMVAGEVETSGRLLSAGGLAVTARDIRNHGLIFGQDAASLSSLGTITNTGQLLSSGPLSLIAGGNLETSGRVASDAAVRFAGADILLDGEVSARQTLAVEALGDITGTGRSALRSSGALQLKSARDLAFAGSAETAGDAAFSASGKLALSGDLAALGTVGVSALSANLAGRVRAGADALVATGESLSASGLIEARNIGLNAGGLLSVAGRVTAERDLGLTSRNLVLTGSASAVGNIHLSSTGTAGIARNALIATNGLLAIDAGHFANEALLAAGTIVADASSLTNQGSLQARENILLNVSGSYAGTGVIIAAGQFQLTGKTLAVGDAVAAGERITLAATQGDAVISGTLRSLGGVTVNASEDVALTGVLASNADVALRSGTNIAIGGALTGRGDVALEADRIRIGAGASLVSGGGFRSEASTAIEIAGSISAGGDLALLGGTRVELAHAQALADGRLDILSAGAVQASGANLFGRNGLTLTGGTLALDAAIMSAGDIELRAQTGASQLSGTLLAQKDVTIAGATDLAFGGRVVAGGSLGLSAGRAMTVNAAGDLLGLGGVSLRSDSLANNGRVTSAEGLSISAITIDNTGLFHADTDVDVNATGKLASTGTIEAGRTLRAMAGDAHLTGRTLSDGAIAINVGGLGTIDGTLAARGPVHVLGTTVDIGGGGLVTTASSITIEGRDIGNAGMLRAAGDATLGAGGNLTTTGRIEAGGSIALTAGALLSSSGTLASIGGITLSSEKWRHDGTAATGGALFAAFDNAEINGLLLADGDIGIDARGTVTFGAMLRGRNIALDARGGSLATTATADILGGSVRLGATGRLDLAGVVGSSGDLALSAASANLAGLLLAGGRFDVVAQDIGILNSGRLAAAADLSLVAAGNIHNLGRIESAGSATLAGTSIDNVGELVGNASLSLRADAQFTNAGAIAAGDRIDLSAASFALGGALGALGDVSISSAGDIRVNGSIETNARLNVLSASGLLDVSGSGRLSSALAVDLRAATAIANAGRIEAEGDIVAVSKTLTNSGTIIARGNIALGGASLLLGGNILSGGDLSLTADRIAEIGGIMSAQRQLRLSAESAQITAPALLTSGVSLEIAGRTIDAAGTILAAGPLSIMGADAVATTGTVQSRGAIVLGAGGLLTVGGSLASLADASLSGGTVTIDGDLRAAGQFDIRAVSGNLSVAGAIGSVGNISLTAAAALDLGTTGTLRSSGTVALGAGTGLNLGGLLFADKAVQLASTGTLLVTGHIETGAALSAAANEVRLDGFTAATDAIGITGRNQTTIGGTVRSGGNIVFNAGGALSLLGTSDIGAAGHAILEAAGPLTQDGLVAAAGGIALAAADLRLSGRVAGNGGITVAGRTTVEGTLSTLADIDIDTGGGALGFDAGGRLLAAGDINLLAGTIVNAGDIDAAGGVRARAASLFINDGRIVADGHLDLAAGDLFATTGLLATSGRLDLEAVRIDLGGRIVSARDVNLATEGDLLFEARLESGGLISLRSTLGAVDITTTGGAAAEGDVTIAAATTLTNRGIVQSRANVIASSGADFDNSGTLSAGGSVALTANGIVSSTGRIEGDAGVSIQGQGLSVDGTTDSLATIRLLSTGQTLVGGTLRAARGLDVSASHIDIGTAATLASGGAVTLQSTGALTSHGFLGADGLLTLKAATGISLGGTTASRSDLSVTAGARLSTLGNIVALGNLSLAAGEANLGGAIASSQSLTVQALAGLSVDGTVTATGLVILDAGSLGVAGTAALLSGAGLSLRAVEDLKNAGDVAAAGSIDISGASINSNGAFRTAGDLGLVATGDIANTGVLAAAGTVALAGATLNVGGKAEALGAVSLNAARDAILSGKLLGNGKVTVSAASGISLLQGGEIGTSAGVDLSAGGMLEISGIVSAAGDVSALSGGLAIGGTLAAAGKAVVTADGVARISGRLSAQDGLSLASTGSDVAIDPTAQLLSGGPLSVSAATALMNAGGIDAQGAITLGAGTRLDQMGRIASGAAVQISTAGSLTHSGNVEALGSIDIHGGAVAAGGTLLSNGGVTIGAAGVLDLSGIIGTAGALTATAGADIGIAGTGQLLAGGLVRINAGNDLIAAGRLESDSGVDIGARAIALGGVLVARGTTMVKARDGLTATGQIIGTGATMITGSSVALGGTLAAGGAIDVAATGGSLSLDGRIEGAATIGLNATEDVAATQGATTLASGTIAFSAGRDLSAAGTIATGDSAMLSAGQALAMTGTLEARGRLDALSGDTLRIGGQVGVIGDIGLAGKTIALEGALFTGAGLDARATSGLSVAGTAGAVGGVLLDAGEGRLFTASAARVETGGAAVLRAGGDIEHGGAVIGDSAALGAGGRLDLTGIVGASRAVALTAGSILDISGGVEAGGDISAAATTIDFIGSGISNGGISLSSTVATNLSGTLSSLGPVNLDSRGDVTVAATGAAVSTSVITAGANGAIRLDGLLSGVTGVSLTADGLFHTGAQSRIESNGDIVLRAASLGIGGTIATAGTLTGVADRISIDGTVATRDTLLSATAEDLLIGGIVAGQNDVVLRAVRNIDATAAGLVIAGRDIDLAAGASLSNAGILSAAQSLRAVAGTTLLNSGAAFAGGNAALSAGADLTVSGTVETIGAASLTGNSIFIHGAVAGNGRVSLTATGNGIDIGGRVTSLDSVAIAAPGTVNVGGSGQVIGVGTVEITAANLDNAGELAAGGTLSATTAQTGGGNIVNSGRIFSDSRIALTAGQSITNTASGRIEVLATPGALSSSIDNAATANIALIAQNRMGGGALDNAGNIASNGSVYVENLSGLLDNRGTISGDLGLTVRAGRIERTAGLRSGLDLSLSSTLGFTNTDGLTAARDLYLSSSISLDNRALLGAGRDLYLSLGGGLTNSSTIFAFGDALIGADGGVANQTNALILAQGNIRFRNAAGTGATGQLDNSSGRIQSLGGDIDIAASSVINRRTNYVVEVETSNPAYPNDPIYRREYLGAGTTAAGEIVAAGNITINAGTTINSLSSILAGNDISITGNLLRNEGDQLEFTRTEIIIQKAMLFAFCDGVSRPAGYTIYSCPSGNLAFPISLFVDVPVQTAITTYTAVPATIQAGGTISINVNTLELIDDIAPGMAPATAGPAVPGAGGGSGTAGVGPAPRGFGGMLQPAAAGMTTAGTQKAKGGNANVAVDARLVTTALDAAATGREAPRAAQSSDAAGRDAAFSAIVAAAGPSVGTAENARAAGLEAVARDATAAKADGGGGSANFAGAGALVPLISDMAVGTAPAPGKRDTIAASNVIVPVNADASFKPAAILVAGTSPATPVDATGAQQDLAQAGGVQAPAAGLVTTAAPAQVSVAMREAVSGLTAPAGAGQLPGFAQSSLSGFLSNFGLATLGADGRFMISGKSGLFRLDESPDARVLFKTDAGFAGQAELFDSDYFFDRAGVDRETRFVRLGDGFFEAQLVGRQIEQLTGRAQLSRYGDVAAQFQGLIAAALAAQGPLNLSLGIALSPAQVAALTSSIVWWVETEFAGRRVLVPVVYLAAADARVLGGGSGSVIAGGNVDIHTAGNLATAGTITAENLLRLRSDGSIENGANARLIGGTTVLAAANDIVNRAGGMIAGGNLLATAGRDIVLEGGTNLTLSGSAALSAGRDISIAALASRTQSSTAMRGGSTATTAINQQTSSINLGGDLLASAGRDISIAGAAIKVGGDAALIAGGDIRIASVAESLESASSWRHSKKNYGQSTSSSVTNIGASLVAGGDIAVQAGGSLAITGSSLMAGGDMSLFANGGIDITSALDTASSASSGRAGKKRFSETADSTTNILSNLSAGGDLSLATSGAFVLKGGTVEAEGAVGLMAGSVLVSGVIDTASVVSDTTVKKSGLVSKKVTTTHYEASNQNVVQSTIAGDRVAIQSLGDITMLGSNIVGTNDVALAAAGAINVGTLVAADHEAQSIKVKKAGLSIGGGGLFAGVAKVSNATSVDTLTNVGSLIGSAEGDVSLLAGKALTITGSTIAAPGLVALSGESVQIRNATDTVDMTSKSKSSSFGLSIKLYENVSGAAKAVSSLPGRVGSSGSGTAGTAISAVSETLRTVSAVTNAVTNTAGISANLGFSKSSSSSESHQTLVAGSSISGGNVQIAAANDIAVTGSKIEAPGNITLAAGGDISLAAAQETLDTRAKSKSSGAGIGVSLGVSLVSGVSASASASFSQSSGRSESHTVSNVNSEVSAGGTLALVSGGDTTLRGAVAQGRDVLATIGGDLTIESVQDLSSRSSKSGGINLGLGYSPAAGGSGFGISGGVQVGSGRGNSAVVAGQSALMASGGSLVATVGGTTSLIGGVIAAVDAEGKDSGQLNLSTGSLIARDIHDSAASKDVSIGLSANINDPFEQGVKGANTPVVDAAYASSTFRQETRATIGQGVVTIGNPAAGTDLAAINRDLAQSQVVTKDKQSGFTLYLDEAAARETVALVKGIATGAPSESVILKGLETLATDPLKPVRDVVGEIQSFSDNLPESGALEKLVTGIDRLVRGNDAVNIDQLNSLVQDPRFAGLSPEGIAEKRIEDRARYIERTQGKEAADAFRAAVKSAPALYNYFLDDAYAIKAIQAAGGNLDAPETLIALQIGSQQPAGAQAATQIEGESVITARPRQLGDAVAANLVAAQTYIDSVDPALRAILEVGLSLGKGPIGALGSFALDKGVEAFMVETGLDRKAAELAIGVGVIGLSILSSSSIEREKEGAASDNGQEAATLTMAGVTILGLATLANTLNSLGKKPSVTVEEAGGGPDKIEPPQAQVPLFTLRQYSDHHDAQAKIVADEYRAQGYIINDKKLQQVTFGGACMADGRCRTDFGGFDPNGRAVVFEVKTGDASLSIRQSAIYPQIRDGNAIPYGEVAAQLGLVPGWPLKDQGYPNGIPVIEIRKPGLGQ